MIEYNLQKHEMYWFKIKMIIENRILTSYTDEHNVKSYVGKEFFKAKRKEYDIILEVINQYFRGANVQHIIAPLKSLIDNHISEIQKILPKESINLDLIKEKADFFAIICARNEVYIELCDIIIQDLKEDK